MSSSLGRRVLVSGALAAALVGCSLQSPPDPPSTVPTVSSAPPIAVSETPPDVVRVEPGTCPDVSGARAATQPPLHAGPFTADDLAPLSQGSPGRKLWVASDRDGEDDAIIVVTDPRQRDLRQRRRSGEATVGGAAQFYAGDIATPVAGTYTIRVTIAADAMCLVVRYR